MRTLRILLIALGLTLFQTGFIFLLSPTTDTPRGKPYLATESPKGFIPASVMSKNLVYRRFLRLLNWDGLHYYDIAQNGYQLPNKPIGALTKREVERYDANVSFFPGFPIAARIFSHILGIPLFTGLIFFSQLCAILVWIYLLLLLERWKVPFSIRWWVILTVLIYPTSFFLVTPYSEGMFLAMLLGFIYWSDAADSSVHYLLAAAHGFLLTSTRLVGVLPSAYPIVQRITIKRLVLTLLAFSGAIAFLLYCQIQFGHWDLYFILEKIGWDNRPDYLALFKPKSYIPYFFFEDTTESISRATVPFLAYLFLKCFRRDPDIQRRLGLYFSAFGIYYVCVSGKANSDMLSMIRITLPTFVLLIACFAQIYAETRTSPARSWQKVLVYFASLFLQGWLAFRYLRGGWAA